MKICFVAWSDFGIGGVPRVLTCLMDALSRKHDVSLYSLKIFRSQASKESTGNKFIFTAEK